MGWERGEGGRSFPGVPRRHSGGVGDLPQFLSGTHTAESNEPVPIPSLLACPVFCVS